MGVHCEDAGKILAAPIYHDEGNPLSRIAANLHERKADIEAASDYMGASNGLA